jgi:hypothetical protein
MATSDEPAPVEPPDAALRLSRRIKRIVDHPTTRMLVGLIMLGSGLSEARENFISDIQKFNFGARHGVMVLGFMNVLEALPHVIEGIERWLDWRVEKG